MNDYEMVSELVNKTGATYEEAKYAYEACNKDMLTAAIMLEKSREAKNSRNDSSGADYKEIWNDARGKFRDNSRKAADCAGGFFRKLCRNTLKVTGSREYFSVPIIAALLIAFMLWEILVPAVIISLICGINFVFTGPDFSKDFVFGFSKPGSTAQQTSQPTAEAPRPEIRPAQYVYTPSEEEQDKGFFN